MDDKATCNDCLFYNPLHDGAGHLVGFCHMTLTGARFIRDTTPCWFFRENRPMPDKPAPVREQSEYFVGMADGCEKVSVSHEKAPVSDDNEKRDKRPVERPSVREKGCAYCCDEHWKRLELDYGWERGRMELVKPVDRDTWMLQAVRRGLHALKRPVHYCPMCGRKLT